MDVAEAVLERRPVDAGRGSKAGEFITSGVSSFGVAMVDYECR